MKVGAVDSSSGSADTPKGIYGQSSASDGHPDQPLEVKCRQKTPKCEAVAKHIIYDIEKTIDESLPKRSFGNLTNERRNLFSYVEFQTRSS